MNNADRKYVENNHRTQERQIARNVWAFDRDPDAELRAEVRASLILECRAPGTEAFAWIIDYNADNELDLTPSQFIALMEKIDADLFTDALLHARRSDAEARRQDYSDADAEDYRQKRGMA